MTYRYTQKNQLLEPCNYHYSKFEGFGFITKFLKNRITFLNEIRSKSYFSEINLQQSNFSWSCILDEFFDNTEEINFSSILKFDSNFNDVKIKISNNIKKQPVEKESLFQKKNINIQTDNLLINIIENQLTKKNKKLSDELLSRFIHQYEVKKKVYEFYNYEIKPSFFGSDKIIDRYLFLSLALSLSLNGNCLEILKRLNCLLKINDLIISVAKDYVTNKFLGNLLILSLMLELGYILKIGRINEKF